MTMLYVMLVWAGASSGGPAMLPGFHSAAACERAIPVVRDWYASGGGNFSASCVALDADGPAGGEPTRGPGPNPATP